MKFSEIKIGQIFENQYIKLSERKIYCIFEEEIFLFKDKFDHGEACWPVKGAKK